MKYNNGENIFTINNENISPGFDEVMVAMKPSINATTLTAARTNIPSSIHTKITDSNLKIGLSLNKTFNFENELVVGPESPVSLSSMYSSPSISPIRSLSQSAGCNKLHSAIKKAQMNLSQSCFADLGGNKAGDIDSELTCLNWLQNGNLINGFTPGMPKKESLPEEEDNSQELRTTSDATETINDIDQSLRKPAYSFSTLIFMAIENAKDKRLPVKDIYRWIQETFPYFQKAPVGWKNSVRHNLSLNKSFKKVDKEKCIGKGSLWTIDHEARAGLVQQLRKTTYHSYPYARPYPQNYTKYFSKDRAMCKRDSAGRFVANRDDAEFDAAAIMCSLSAPSLFRYMEQRSKLSLDKQSSAELLQKWRTFIEPGDWQDDAAWENNKSYSVDNFLDEVHKKLYGKRKTKINERDNDDGIDSSLDEEYEFCNSDDDLSEDDEMTKNMKRLVDKEIDYDLGDSGYSENLFTLDHSYSKPINSLILPCFKRESTGVAALLHLANAAAMQLKHQSCGPKITKEQSTLTEFNDNNQMIDADLDFTIESKFSGLVELVN
ncbi:forkhead box protein N2 [Hydra vulgaris]|uniref:Forkhead box protein N2 n=1 Tax=Hydra vulgaris TaxID=6087 RepID=A0ABM4C2T9_HYDVU